MSASEGVFLAQRAHWPFVNQIATGQFTGGHASVGKQSTRATLNVDP